MNVLHVVPPPLSPFLSIVRVEVAVDNPAGSSVTNNLLPPSMMSLLQTAEITNTSCSLSHLPSGRVKFCHNQVFISCKT